MLQSLATRLGTRLLFILCLAVVIRVAGGLFSPHHPKPRAPIASATDPFSGSDAAASDLVGSAGEDPTSEAMRAAIERVRQDGRAWGDSSEAQLTFGAGGPDPVVVTPSELAAAREYLSRLNGQIDGQFRAIKRDESPDAVSFEPGRPMIDPNPQN